MKRTILYLGGFILVASLLGGCVSKKKYEELARAKRSVDRNLLELKKEKSQLEKTLQVTIDDFNTIRYKLTQNNAEKDKAIDKQYSKLRSLEGKEKELKTELSDVAYQIQTNTTSSTEQITALEKNLQKISIERDQLRKQLTEVQTELEFEIRKIKSQLETATTHAGGKDEEITKLKADHEEMEKKLAWIRKTKTSADVEIKKLTNQVDLLKKELNKIK